VTNHFRLFGNFLGHEVPVIALVHDQPRDLAEAHWPAHRAPRHIIDLRGPARQNHPVTIFKIGDPIGERRQRNRITSKKHLAVAMTDCQRRTILRPYQQVVFALEQDRQRKCPLQPREHGLYRVSRCLTLFQGACKQLHDNFRVSLGVEDRTTGDQFFLEGSKIFNDAVVNDHNIPGHVGMCICFGNPTMRCPARVADAGCAAQGLPCDQLSQIAELSHCPASFDSFSVERGHAG
jgi:hypothetical protein